MLLVLVRLTRHCDGNSVVLTIGCLVLRSDDIGALRSENGAQRVQIVPARAYSSLPQHFATVDRDGPEGGEVVVLHQAVHHLGVERRTDYT